MFKWHTFYDRSMLKKKIDYITRPGVEYVDVRNLSTYRGNYAEQFNETFRLYGKRTDKDKPQYYGIIVNYDPRDNPSPKDVQESCVRLMEITFPDFECVIATHTNTGKVHTHIIMNSVNLVTGFKLEFNKTDWKMMKEEHIKIGESYGYTHTRVTEPDPDYRTTAELRILERGGWSWKDDIRKFVRGAIEDVRVTTLEDFMAYLSDYNMEVLDNGKRFLYFHPKKTQGVRGKKLGPYYTRESVMAAMEKNCEAAERREVERLEAERQEAEKTPSISRLDEYNKIEVWFRYAEHEIKNNYLYYDFNDFVEKVEEIEKRCNRVVYVSDCIDDALKNPLSEKDYGELTSEDFYREKRYALFCAECVRDKMEPVNRDTFYRDNGWEDTENRVKQEPVGQEGNKAVSIDMLDDYTKVEVWFRYAENSVKTGRSWIDFDNLIEYVKDAERRDCLDLSLFGYIEVGFRNPVSKKEYGELSSVEFYHEKRYALSVEECKRDNKIPLSRDDFYRDNSWGVPESLARLEAERQEAGNHEVENHEVENHEVASQEVASQEATSQEVASQEAASQEVASQEAASQEATSQEVASQEVASQEAASQEVASQEVEKQEVEKQEVEKQEVKKQEVEKQEVEKQEVEKQEVEKREVEKQEAEKQEAEKQEAASHEAARQEVEKKEIAQTSSINQLDVYNKIEVWFSYAKREIEKNNLYYDFNDFVEKVEEIEKEGNRVVYVSDCIDDALKNPITEKDLGNLNANEFYCEMAYELYCEECQSDNEIPLSSDDFYRYNDWTVSESLAKEEATSQEVGDQEDGGSEDEDQEDINRDGEKQVSISQLDDHTKVSAWFEYAKDQVKWGSPYHDFLVFETYIKNHEESGTFAIGKEYVEEAFKHPTTEKEYGKLDSTEFYHEKRYELYLIECAKDKKSPLSREEFYRENVWRVPKCLAEQSKATADGGSANPGDGNSPKTHSAGPDAVSIDQLDDCTSAAVWFRYAEKKVKDGESYLDYYAFLKKIRDEEKAGLVDDTVRGYIKEGFKNSTIEKGYERLCFIELGYELNYVLYVDECVRDGKIPCDREKYYESHNYMLTLRLKERPDGATVATIGRTPSADGVPARGTSGREESAKDGTSENPPAHKQNAVSIDMLDKYTLVYVWAEYSEDLINEGKQMYKFEGFVRRVKEAEREGSLSPRLKGYIEDGVKAPMTEKDYGKLSPEEFRRKKDYDLECVYRRHYNMSPVSIEEFYRQKGWPVPDSLKKRRDNYMGK